MTPIFDFSKLEYYKNQLDNIESSEQPFSQLEKNKLNFKKIQYNDMIFKVPQQGKQKKKK